MKQKIFIGERVYLRPLKVSDAPIFSRWMSDKLVVRYLEAQQPVNLADEQAWIRKMQRKKNIHTWTVEVNKRIIGNAALRYFPIDKRVNFGIVIGEKDAWGNGYAGEILEIFTQYVFIQLGYNRFELTVAMSNKQGLRAYKKAGFILEGVRRQAKYNSVTKKLEDEGVMSILKNDWLKKRK